MKDKPGIVDRAFLWIGKQIEKRSIFVDKTTSYGIPYSTQNTSVSYQNAMLLAAYYRGVDVKSDAMASMPIRAERLGQEGWTAHPEDDDLNYILNVEPSVTFSKFDMMKASMAMVDNKGNAIMKITRDERLNPVRIHLNTDEVTIYMDKNGILYYRFYFGDGTHQTLEQSDVIHLKNFSYNGIVGVSTIRHAVNTLNLAAKNESQAKTGANLGGILEVEGRLDTTKATALKTAWNTAFNDDDATPGLAVIEKGMKFTPVGVSSREAQLLDSRVHNNIDLCRFLGVSPPKVFDTTGQSYNTIESYQLAFLTDTISPRVHQWENEFRRKLFKPSVRKSARIRFDMKALQRADLASLANYYSKLWPTSAYLTNEVRDEIGNPRIENGNIPFVPVNVQPMSLFTKKPQNDPQND